MSKKLSNKVKLIILGGIILFFIGVFWIFNIFFIAGNHLSTSSDNGPFDIQNSNIPEYYKKLSIDEREFKIIEYPLILQKRYNPLSYYQIFHGKEIVYGYFLSHALKKQWRIKHLLDADIWPAEIILSRLENNKINFSNIIDSFTNVINLYNINSIRNSDAKYIILHKRLKDEISIAGKNNDPRVREDLVKGIGSQRVWEHIYKSSLHFKKYYQRYFGKPVYEDEFLIVFQI